MNDFNATMGVVGTTWPSPWYIAGALLFGLIGYAAFRHGRTTKTPVILWTGVVLMVYPYAVSQTWMLWMVGIGLCVWLYWQGRR